MADNTGVDPDAFVARIVFETISQAAVIYYPLQYLKTLIKNLLTIKEKLFSTCQ